MFSRAPLGRAAVLFGALAAALVVALPGCSVETAGLPAAALEDEVAALYPAAEGTRVAVTCDGPLGGEVGATRDCAVRVGGDRGTVRATVTEETVDGPVFTTVPVVAADEVARTVLRALVRDGYVVGQVVCRAELPGVVGASVACRAAPPDGGRRTRVQATVREVDGLDVRLRYRLVG